VLERGVRQLLAILRKEAGYKNCCLPPRAVVPVLLHAHATAKKLPLPDVEAVVLMSLI
jgi:hypothetical protein